MGDEILLYHRKIMAVTHSPISVSLDEVRFELRDFLFEFVDRMRE